MNFFSLGIQTKELNKIIVRDRDNEQSQTYRHLKEHIHVQAQDNL